MIKLQAINIHLGCFVLCCVEDIFGLQTNSFSQLVFIFFTLRPYKTSKKFNLIFFLIDVRRRGWKKNHEWLLRWVQATKPVCLWYFVVFIWRKENKKSSTVIYRGIVVFISMIFFIVWKISRFFFTNSNLSFLVFGDLNMFHSYFVWNGKKTTTKKNIQKKKN